MYTDESKQYRVKIVGATVLSQDLGFGSKVSLMGGSLVFTAECLATSLALDLVLESEARNFLIFSDSWRALQSLEGRLFNVKTNRYIQEIKSKYLNFTPRYPEKTLEFL